MKRRLLFMAIYHDNKPILSFFVYKNIGGCLNVKRLGKISLNCQVIAPKNDKKVFWNVKRFNFVSNILFNPLILWF